MARVLSLGCEMQVMDLGSLNGTTLNGRIISTSNRRRGRLWRLNDGDQLQLGVHSGIKITYLPLADAPVRLPSTSSLEAVASVAGACCIAGFQCCTCVGLICKRSFQCRIIKNMFPSNFLKCLANLPTCKPSS